MAKYRHGINGIFSGKVGDLVCSRWRGTSYIKSRPKPSNKPKTDKQLAQQAKFGFAVRFLNPVKDILNIGYKQQRGKPSGFNLAMKYTLADVITGEYPDLAIDYSKVRFSNGRWSQPACVKLLPSAGSLAVIWHGDGFRPFAYGDDLVYILIYEPESNTYLKGPADVRRAQEACIIAIPSHWAGKTIHTYLFCVSSCGRASDTVYAGEVIV